MHTSRRHATLATLVGTSSATLIVSLQAVVLIPLYLRAVGPQLYGAWLGSGDFLVWMQILDFGLPNLMIQRIGAAHGAGNSKAVGEYFAAGVVTMALVALVIGLAAFALSFFLPGWMGLAGAPARLLQQCFLVGVVAGAAQLFCNSVVGFARGVQNTGFMNGVTVVSALAGFAVSLVLVLAGWGLWSVALGLAARAAVTVAGSGVFTMRELQSELRRSFRVRRAVLAEFLRNVPSTALGGLGYALMNQSETALVAIFLRPELAVVLNLTRKALDVARGLVDSIAAATYGGFAHITTSGQRHRVLQVHAEISALRLSLAVALAAAYMAVNASLLAVWVGAAQYGGPLLTILVAFQFIVVGQSYLANNLYRAVGRVQHGSLALAAESLVRLPLILALLLWLGLPGIPLAGLVTGAVFGLLAYRWTVKAVAGFAEPGPAVSLLAWGTRAMVVGLGVILSLTSGWEHWIYVLVVGGAVVLLGTALQFLTDPALKSTLKLLTSKLRWTRSPLPVTLE